MKKQNPLILSIPNPCTENWAEMSIVDKGRFCSHCRAVVTDLTVLSDAAIVRLFEQEPDTHCIRAFASQLNRPLTLPVQNPTRFYRIALALGLTIMMAGTAGAYARPKAPLSEQNYLLHPDDTTKQNAGSDSSGFSGVVMTNKGDSLDGVLVHLKKDGVLYKAVLTDEQGSFSFWVDNPGSYQLEFKKQGFAVRTVNVSTTNPYIKKGLTIRMLYAQFYQTKHAQDRVMSGPPPIPNRRVK